MVARVLWVVVRVFLWISHGALDGCQSFAVRLLEFSMWWLVSCYVVVSVFWVVLGGGCQGIAKWLLGSSG